MKTEATKVLVRNVRKLMEMHNIPSEAQLARAASISQRAINNLMNDESGLRSPTVETVEILAEYFGLGAADLMSLDLNSSMPPDVLSVARQLANLPAAERAEAARFVDYLAHRSTSAKPAALAEIPPAAEPAPVAYAAPQHLSSEATMTKALSRTRAKRRSGKGNQ